MQRSVRSIIGVLAVAGLFVAGVRTGDEVKASSRLKALRMNCTTDAGLVPPADGAFHTAASVTVSNKIAGGIVHVSASGVTGYFGAPGAGGLILSLATAPDTEGPWFWAISEDDPNPFFGVPTDSWTVENCFRGMPAGPNTYYLNVFSADGAASVETCSMTAVYYANPLTERCE